MTDLDIKKNFNLAQNCIIPLINQTQNKAELAELIQIKNVIESHSGYITFRKNSKQETMIHFNQLVGKYADKMVASFVI